MARRQKRLSDAALKRRYGTCGAERCNEPANPDATCKHCGRRSCGEHMRTLHVHVYVEVPHPELIQMVPLCDVCAVKVTEGLKERPGEAAKALLEALGGSTRT